MSLEIRKQFVSNFRNTYGRINKKRYITIHETANTREGANAQAHANLQSRGFTASFHWQVDDKEAIQSYEHDVACWHAGDGRGNGNLNSIAIEICVNSDGDFSRAIANAAELVRKIMSEENIPVENVVQHNRWSGKNCPANLRSGSKGIDWADFISLIKNGNKANETSKKVEKLSKPKTEVKAVKSTSKSKPKTKAPKANLKVDGSWGKATTRALQSALGTPVDGIISGQYNNATTRALYGGTVAFGRSGSLVIRALQRKVGATVDGYLGPETVRKLQAYLGTPVDGVISTPSSLMVREMQRRLNEGTF